MKLHLPKPCEFRVMTYNVHSCIGTDGRHDPHRIAEVIAAYNPDIIALQELDNGYSRSSRLHHAQHIAERLQLHFHFHSVREIADQQFGNAILSRFPMGILRAGGLPTLTGRRMVQDRGALWVELEISGRPLQILATHFGLWPKERLMQAHALLGKDWLGNRDTSIPLVVCGDFNAIPRTAAYRHMATQLADVQKQISTFRPRKTFPSRFPLIRLDHIFISNDLKPTKLEVPNSPLTQLASDHLPLIADLAFLDTVKTVNTIAPSISIKKGGKHVA